MKQINISYTLLLTVLFTAVSCTKHAGEKEEAAASASLNITFPTTNQVISQQDSIRISASAIAVTVMHGYDLYLTKRSDTVKLVTVSVHDHNDTLLIDKKLAPQPAGNYDAHILLKLDHDGNTLHKKVSFSTQ
jgi:hypothetical protein